MVIDREQDVRCGVWLVGDGTSDSRHRLPLDPARLKDVAEGS